LFEFTNFADIRK